MMILGIEIGGTKLQMGVGQAGSTKFAHAVRLDINPQNHAEGIRKQIATAGKELTEQFPIQHIGVGFGGAVDVATGRTIKSNQITGWEDFPFATWLSDIFDTPATIVNDCDAAALAEATTGAGKDFQSLFYITVGSGIGGGFVVNQTLFGQTRSAISEIGQLRISQDGEPKTVESQASGWGMTEIARKHFTTSNNNKWDESTSLLFQLCEGDPQKITTIFIAKAAAQGDTYSQSILQQATRTLGWAIGQVITLVAPEVIVIGGGVPLMSNDLFFNPLVEDVSKFVYQPLQNSYQILPASLGEWVVVHGAIAVGDHALHSS